MKYSGHWHSFCRLCLVGKIHRGLRPGFTFTAIGLPACTVLLSLQRARDNGIPPKKRWRIAADHIQ